LLISSSSRFVLLFHSPFSYLGPCILLNTFLSKIRTACSSFLINSYRRFDKGSWFYLQVQGLKETSIKVGSKRRRKLESSYRSHCIIDCFPGFGEGKYESGKSRDRTNEQKHIKDGNKIWKQTRKSKMNMCVTSFTGV
jgi:hypothetical protein